MYTCSVWKVNIYECRSPSAAGKCILEKEGPKRKRDVVVVRKGLLFGDGGDRRLIVGVGSF